MSTTSFPLCWPVGWPRETYRRDPRHPFKNNTFTRARESLATELERLRADDIILSTNVPLRIDGQPRGDYRDRLTDPGVAVYFTLSDRRPMVMARDAYPLVSDNLRSLALAVEHLRGLERHGGGQMVERAFTGFAALPDPGAKKSWHAALGIEPGVELTVELVEARHRELAMRHHPDRNGGAGEALMAEINQARDEALRCLNPEGATA